MRHLILSNANSENFLEKEKDSRFYTLVDVASESNKIVERFKLDLKEFADLRNAIVHERTDGRVIAEPHDEVVQKIEHIKSLLLDPPKVGSYFTKNVVTVYGEDSIAKAIKIMFDHSFSQVPVYNGDTFIGMLTANTITRWLGENLEEDIFSLSETSVGNVLRYVEDKEEYCFISKNSTLVDALIKFELFKDGGKRLEAILITQSGKPTEKLLGIITVWDIPKIYKVLNGT